MENEKKAPQLELHFDPEQKAASHTLHLCDREAGVG